MFTSRGVAMIFPTVCRGFSDEYGSLEDDLQILPQLAKPLPFEVGDVDTLELGPFRPWLREASPTCVPVVVLPQPDSPTRPSDSPCSTSKSSPSTACTFCLLPNRPLRTMKCFVRPRTRRIGESVSGVESVPAAASN